ncbi:MAG: hypothetical protein HC919_15265 [Oscillatoriales cyanobacterium SM2_2_1]|nr:hypothetical protein [Oscillatoriales cyanobacterium SM2_2_1]
MDYLNVQLLFYLSRRGDMGKVTSQGVLLRILVYGGILFGFALTIMPSFLNQPCKIKQSEVRTYTGLLNKGQQAYFTEHKRFGSNIKVLGVGINTDTKNFTYTTTVSPFDGKNMANNYALNVAIPAAREERNPTNFWKSEARSARAYIGRVNIAYVPESSDVVSLAILCEAKQVNTPLTIADTEFFQKPGQDAVLSCVGNAESVGN